jgi:hypothetical protein
MLELSYTLTDVESDPHIGFVADWREKDEARRNEMEKVNVSRTCPECSPNVP